MTNIYKLVVGNRSQPVATIIVLLVHYSKEFVYREIIKLNSLVEKRDQDQFNPCISYPMSYGRANGTIDDGNGNKPDGSRDTTRDLRTL